MYNNPYMQSLPYNMDCGCNAMPDYTMMENKMMENIMMPEYNMMPDYKPMPQYAMPMEYAKPYPAFKDKRCVKVPQVIGRNHCEILLETDIPFAPGYPALEIKDIMKEVSELITAVCADKVLLNGKLHKNINYKTFQSMGRVKCDCEELNVAYGNVKHVSIHIPFKGYIEVPGARPGDTVEVEFAGVEDCCELDILKDPCYVRGCPYPLYKKLREKVIVKIDVKVLRPVQITVDPESPNICP